MLAKSFRMLRMLARASETLSNTRRTDRCMERARERRSSIKSLIFYLFQTTNLWQGDKCRKTHPPTHCQTCTGGRLVGEGSQLTGGISNFDPHVTVHVLAQPQAQRGSVYTSGRELTLLAWFVLVWCSPTKMCTHLFTPTDSVTHAPRGGSLRGVICTEGRQEGRKREREREEPGGPSRWVEEEEEETDREGGGLLFGRGPCVQRKREVANARTPGLSSVYGVGGRVCHVMRGARECPGVRHTDYMPLETRIARRRLPTVEACIRLTTRRRSPRPLSRHRHKGR